MIFSFSSPPLFSSLLFSFLRFSLLFSSFVLTLLLHVSSSFSLFFFSFLFSCLLLLFSLSFSFSLFRLLFSLSVFFLRVLVVCVSSCVSSCVFVCVVWCGVVCGTLKTPCVDSKTPPCVDSKRPRVCRQHAHMLTTNQVISNRLRWCGNCLPVSTSTDTRHVAPSSATTPDTLPEVLMKQTSNATAGTVDSARSSVTRL